MTRNFDPLKKESHKINSIFNKYPLKIFDQENRNVPSEIILFHCSLALARAQANRVWGP